MREDDQLLGLRDYLEILQRRRRLILAVALALVVAAIVATLVSRPSHRATVELLVPLPSTTDVLGQAVFGDLDLRTQQRLVRSSEVAGRVGRALGIGDDPEQLRALLDRVSVDLVPESSVMIIGAEHRDPGVSVAIPQQFAEQYIAYVRELVQTRSETARRLLHNRVDDLENRLVDLESQSPPTQGRQPAAERERLVAQLSAVEGELSELAVVEELASAGRIISPAAAEDTPSAVDRLSRNIGLALILGATLGVILALVREWAEDVLVRERDVAVITGRPVIANVKLGSDSATQEAYRTIRATLKAALDAAPGVADADLGDLDTPTVLVMGVGEHDASPEVAGRLASAFAAAGTRTLLVTPPGETTISEQLSTSPHWQRRPHEPQRPSGDTQKEIRPPLEVASLDDWGQDVGEELTREGFTSAVRPHRGDADLVVAEAGAAGNIGLALELSTVASWTILVVTVGNTSTDALRSTSDRLGQLGVPVLGTVLARR